MPYRDEIPLNSDFYKYENLNLDNVFTKIAERFSDNSFGNYLKLHSNFRLSVLNEIDKYISYLDKEDGEDELFKQFKRDLMHHYENYIKATKNN